MNISDTLADLTDEFTEKQTTFSLFSLITKQFKGVCEDMFWFRVFSRKQPCFVCKAEITHGFECGATCTEMNICLSCIATQFVCNLCFSF